jgi:ribose 1,5-bisphosphate isomerase
MNNQHPYLDQVIEQLSRQELHAARSGREVMSALAKLVAGSHATNTQDLVNEVDNAVDTLLTVMPAYAPPLNVLHWIISLCEKALINGMEVEQLKAVIAEADQEFFRWSTNARSKISMFGASLIPSGSTIFTFTLSETTLTMLLFCKKQGKFFRVLVTESRPNNDGLMTADRLAQEHIPVEIGIDACIGELVPRADMMVVGAEAVMADGSVICKIGTYPAALVAHSHGIPVYVLVDTLKFNVTSLIGIPLWLDPIKPGCIPIPSSSSPPVIGHLFDTTPPELIRGLITEEGILNPKEAIVLMNRMPFSERFGQKLHHWLVASH